MCVKGGLKKQRGLHAHEGEMGARTGNGEDCGITVEAEQTKRAARKTRKIARRLKRAARMNDKMAGELESSAEQWFARISHG